MLLRCVQKCVGTFGQRCVLFLEKKVTFLFSENYFGVLIAKHLKGCL